MPTTPAFFDGQEAGFPVQMTKDAADENMVLDSVAVDDSNQVWVLYSTTYYGGASGTHTLRYRIYNIASGTWSASVEVYGDTVGETYAGYGAGSSYIVGNRNGDMFVVFVSGTNAGSAVMRARVIRADGTLTALTTVPDSGGDITTASAVASNNCYDWTIIDNGGPLSGAINRVRAVDYNQSTLAWGNERYLYRADTFGVDFPVCAPYSYSASFSPPENSVHAIIAVKTLNTGATPYKLMHCWDGGTPTVTEIPENLITSTSYNHPFPTITCDNITAGTASIMYTFNQLYTDNVGGSGETNFMDSIGYRQITDNAMGGATALYIKQGPPYSVDHARCVIDGSGNLYTYFTRDAVLILAGLEWKYAKPVAASIPGLAMMRRPRYGDWMTSLDDVEEVFFSNSDSSPTATYSRFRSATPTPGHSILVVAAAKDDADGGTITAAEGIYINYAEVAEGAVDEEGDRVTEGCMGVDLSETAYAQQLYVMDVRGKDGRAWYKHSVVNARILHKNDEVNDTGELLFGSPAGSQGGKVWRLDYGDNDDTSLIKWCWQTPWHDLGEPETVKRFRYIGLDIVDISGGIRVDWSVDGGKATGWFEAQQKGKYWWGDSLNNRSFLWNNSAGSQLQGMFWIDRKAGEMVWSLPQSCLGRRIQATFSGTYGTPIKQVGYFIEHDGKRQLYPSTEETL